MEIDTTFLSLHRLNKAGTSDSGNIFSYINFDSKFDFSIYTMVARTFRELPTPDVTYNALCIKYPYVDVPFELKFGMIHLLPKQVLSQARMI